MIARLSRDATWSGPQLTTAIWPQNPRHLIGSLIRAGNQPDLAGAGLLAAVRPIRSVALSRERMGDIRRVQLSSVPWNE